MPTPPPLHRGGTGAPLVLLHGVTATWTIWRPVLAGLEAHHDVLAPTLPGHFGGPPIALGTTITIADLADGVERAMDEAGFDLAHIVGNSLGGWLAIELGRRGRALSVVGLSPGGAWSRPRDRSRVLRQIESLPTMIRRGRALGTDNLMRRPRFRRLAFRGTMEHGERVTPAEASELIDGVLGCEALPGFFAWVRQTSSIAPPETAQSYPIRIAWAQHDRTLPFRRYGAPMLAAVPGAEHLTLPAVGHVPMWDDPGLVIETILQVTATSRSLSAA
jgi:pimeloyl-ACP methyl ester carboxylesterase